MRLIWTLALILSFEAEAKYHVRATLCELRFRTADAFGLRPSSFVTGLGEFDDLLHEKLGGASLRTRVTGMARAFELADEWLRQPELDEGSRRPYPILREELETELSRLVPGAGE